MKKNVLLLFCFLHSLITFAQNPADVEHEFGAIPGFSFIVNLITLQPDGKILVGGAFTTYLGTVENRLIRLNVDGSKDKSFNIGTGFNGSVYSVILQPDGKILVGGNFTTFNGVNQNRLIRLNPDGSKDNSFNIGTGFNEAYVVSMALQPDGKIVIGGYFTKFQGVFENHLIRLNEDGSKDTSFNIGTGLNGSVLSIALQTDGKIILGGGFKTLNGESQNYLTRLNTDGSKDASFDIGTGIGTSNYSCSVNFITLQNDGKILVGGDFTTYKGLFQEFLVRLNSDGSKDTTFNMGNGLGSFSSVYSITLQNDGKIIVGGDFTEYRDQDAPQNRLIRFNSDGSKDNSFSIGTGFNDIVQYTALQDDGKIIVVGYFTTYQGVTQNRIIRLNSNGSKDISFNKTDGFDFSVTCTALQSDGKLLVGGEFTTYNGASQNRLIRFNTDGSKDSSFDIGTGFEYAVNSITVQTDGKILVAGDFYTYKGASVPHLIRLNPDGSKDTFFNITAVIQRSSNIVLQSDGKILVGDDFSTPYQGSPKKGLIRLNSNGSTDSSFEVGTQFGSGQIYSLALQNDGKIIAAGYFTTSTNGSVQNCLIRLNTDGSKDSSFNIGSGFNNTVLSLAIQSDGKILVNGKFTTYQGVSQKSLIRLNSDGSIDPSFALGNANVSALKAGSLQNDGKIIIIQNGLVRLNSNGSVDSSFNIETGFNTNAVINSIDIQPDGQILVGGKFSTYQGNNRSAFLISLKGTETNLSNEKFDKNENLFSLWPNPAHTILNINASNNSIPTAKIYDLQGKLLYSKEKAEPTIDVSSFNNGMYLINLKNESGETTQKFIKQ